MDEALSHSRNARMLWLSKHADHARQTLSGTSVDLRFSLPDEHRPVGTHHTQVRQLQAPVFDCEVDANQHF